MQYLPVTGDLSAALAPKSPGPTEPITWKPDQIYQVLENAAAAHDLPLEFFVRLIRQESNFDPNSVSHAGAQGIAQFMPGTARWRGLADPFEPLQVLHQTARWLRELRGKQPVSNAETMPRENWRPRPITKADLLWGVQ